MLAIIIITEMTLVMALTSAAGLFSYCLALEYRQTTIKLLINQCG